MKRNRALIIGLDMGDLALIEKWSQADFLPTFRSLMTEGMWGKLQTTAEALHTSSWPTIFTGCLPGKHGVYYPYQPCPGLQQAKHIGPQQYGAAPVWQTLDSAGKRCIILDAPETFPATGFSGVQIFEWGTWAWYWRRMIAPVEVESEVTRKFGSYPLKLEAKRLGLGMPDLGYLHRELIAGTVQKAKMTRWLMQSHPWDFFLVVFAELHPAGHYFWPKGAQIVDVDGSGSTEDFAALQLRDIYVAVDAAIGEIIKDCEDDVTVFIVSGDGVGPNHCAWHLLPQILSRSGFTKELSFVNAQRHLKGSLIHRLRDAIPSRLRAEIAAQLPWQLRDRLAHQLTAGKIDWSRTVAFSLPADLEGCVRINLRGREPQGVVEPGGQYEDICAELTEVLEQLVNPLTGRRAVRRVCQVDHLFPGARRDHLPDLTVIWNDEAEINEVYSERLGLVSEASVDPRTGTHYPRSFIAVRGPRTERGKKIEGGHIADLAPSFLAKFGIDRPSEMDGRALDIFQ